MKKAKKTKAKAAAAEENGEATGKKKGGKKKLLLIPIALVLVAGIAAAAIFVVLPKFGINLLGDSSDDTNNPEEPLPKKGVETYAIGENSAPSLDTILLEGEGALIALRSPGRYFTDGSNEVEERYTYIYELTGFAGIMNRYLDVLMGEEQGFYITNESYVVQEERPELQDESGAMILARNATVPEGEEPEGNNVFQLVIGWSEDSANLAVRVSNAPGKISFPKKEEETAANHQEPSSVSLQMEQLRNRSPALLGLAGTSMDNYTIFPVDGFVKVNDLDCRQFNIYEKNRPGTIAGTYFFSVDQEHIYVRNPDGQSVSTIK